MRRLLSIIPILLLFSIASAQQKAESVVAVKAPGSKFQFVNRQSGIPVDQLLLDETDLFINGYARVFLNKKFSFVDGNGKLIHPLEFEDARNFVNNLAAVKKNGKWGFIDESGKQVFPFNYEIAFDFDGSVSAAYEQKKWWLINNKGEVVMPLDISVCYGFKNGVAKITKDDREGFLYPDGRIVLNLAKTSSSKYIPYHPHFNNPGNNNLVPDCPDNIDFENGDFFNWECFIGHVDSVGNTNVITVNPSPPTPNRHTLIQRSTPSGIDPYGLFPTNPPDGSNYCVKLGNTNVGAEAERVRYTIHVPLNDSNFSIKYDYAVVLQDPGHTPWTQPRFNAKILDSATNTYINCASFEYISTSNLPGFAHSTVNASVIYKPWSSVFFSFRGYGGHTMYLEFTTADCVRRAHWGYAYLDVQSNCGQAIDAQYDCNYPNITTLTAPPGFQYYNWWDSAFTTIIGTGQQLVMNPGPTVNSVFWVEMIPFANFGCTDTLKATISGALSANFTMSPPSGCAPLTVTLYNSVLPSSSTLWDFGDGNTATGDTVTHTYNTPGTYTVQLNVTSASGCNGTASHYVIVRPPSNMNQPVNQTFCPNDTTNSIVFISTLSGTIYNWTNDNPAIGLPASGIGNIPSFVTNNPGTVPILANILVSPSTGGCPGPSKTFTITIRPTPRVVQPANQSLCNGATTNAVTMSGNLANMLFMWTNDNPSIGLSASGNGNIPAFSATNNTNAPVTATITITPFVSVCPGPSETFTITVNPTPNVLQPANQTLCNGSATNTIAFAGAVSGTAFSWTNSNPSIGLAASGNGNIASFNAVNNSNVPVSATITVTPSASGCTGNPETFTITVNPIPDVVTPPNQSLCSGSATNSIIFTGAVNSTVFNWTNNDPSIGLAASGNGNIAPFTATNTTGAPVTATITVTPSTSGCTGLPIFFIITVNPVADVVQPADQTLCNGVVTNAINFTGMVTGASFNWTNSNASIGLASSGSGNIPAFTTVNTTSVPITATITVTPSAFGCTGTPKIFTITVNPTADVVQPANQTLCNGGTTTATTFSGSIAGTSFIWTNNTPSIGLAASGTGNIPAFHATNTTNVPVTANITVTPSAFGCPGTPKTFTILVNPTADILQPPNQTLCNSGITSPIIFTSTVNGTTCTWVNTAPSIGLPASGTGNIASFTALSNGFSVSVATITVTPIAFGCIGPDKRFTITVNPVPNVLFQPPSQSLCNGATTNLITFTGSMGNAATYTWSNSNPSIGLATSGSGNIASFTAINTGNTDITAVITVTPITSSCQGSPKTMTITVHPTPAVVASNNNFVCLGGSIQLSVTGAAQYLWSPAGTLSCNTCTNPVATPTDTTQYVVKGTSAFGCTANDTVSINVVKPFQMLHVPNDTLCIGESGVLGASGAKTYLWSPPTGLNRVDIASPTASPNVSTLYRVVGYDGYGCFTDTGFVMITVGPKPLLDIGPNLTLSTGSTVQLHPVTQNGPIISWVWTPSAGLSCANCPEPILTVADSRYYILTVTNNYGCIVNDTIFINSFCKNAQVFIPNAFTPDGDGLNDILMVRGRGIFVKTFRIFNRWGELVFEKTNFNPNDPKYGWDGKVRGVPATPDVFVYTAEVICDNGIIYTYKGNTTLLK